MSNPSLTAVEARVVAALVEKSVTTPQYYPMSANAIMLAANQKNCRSPVMSLNEGEVNNALIQLEDLKLVSRDALSSARVTKWRHSFNHQMLLDTPQTAVLAMLILRGPQTVAELRANASPLKGPADDAGINTVLQDFAERATPLVVQLPRAPGQAATRYAHTLSGEPAAAEAYVAPAALAAAPARSDRYEALEARIAALEARLAEIEAKLPQ